MLEAMDKEMNKGLIMEIEGSFGIVLTHTGEFRRIKLDRAGRRVGEEIVLPADSGLTASFGRWLREAAWRIGRPRYVMAAVTVAAAFILIAVPASLTRNVPATPGAPDAGPIMGEIFAYITVDINPSIELGVDAAGNVVTVRALNADAELILEKVNLTGMTVEEAVDEMVSVAADEGYLAVGEENVIVIAAVSATEAAPIPEAVKQQVNNGRARVQRKMAERNLTVDVVAIEAPAVEIKQDAAEMGMSVGKYLIFLEARKAGVELTPEEIKDQPVGRVLKSKGFKPGEIIRRAEENEDEFEDMAREFRNSDEFKPGRGLGRERDDDGESSDAEVSIDIIGGEGTDEEEEKEGRDGRSGDRGDDRGNDRNGRGKVDDNDKDKGKDKDKDDKKSDPVPEMEGDGAEEEIGSGNPGRSDGGGQPVGRPR